MSSCFCLCVWVGWLWLKAHDCCCSAAATLYSTLKNTKQNKIIKKSPRVPPLSRTLTVRCCRRRADATSHLGRHQRAPGVSVLPPDLQLLLLAQTPLPGQTRTVGHTVRVRVLSQEVPYQKLTYNAQESAASGIERHAQASAQDYRHQERTRTSASSASAVTTLWCCCTKSPRYDLLLGDHITYFPHGDCLDDNQKKKNETRYHDLNNSSYVFMYNFLFVVGHDEGTIMRAMKDTQFKSTNASVNFELTTVILSIIDTTTL